MSLSGVLILQDVCRLCDQINACFGHIMFLYVSLGVAILSVTGYQTLKVSMKKL